MLDNAIVDIVVIGSLPWRQYAEDSGVAQFLRLYAGLLIAIAHAAQTGCLTFLSTQLRPIEEAQKCAT